MVHRQQARHLLASLARKVSSFPALIAVILAARVYWSCRDNIAEPDFWWHLRDAQYLLTNLRFPTIDSYSFTAAGSPWLNHEWLPEVLFYGAFTNSGLIGVFVLFTALLIVLVITVFLLSMKESGDPLAAGIATIFGGLLAMIGFSPRAQNFGWLCFIGIYAILLRFRRTKDGPLWLVPVLFCLWINCHGSWLIGLIIYTIFVASGLIRRDIGHVVAAPWERGELKRLIVTGAISLSALCVNPFGYRLLTYPFDTNFHQKLGVGTVEEWASINFNEPRGQLVALVLGSIFAMACIARKRWRVDDVLLTLFVLYCGVTHVRFLLLAGIVLPPILAPQLGRISSYDPSRERRLLNSILLALIAVVGVLGFPSRRMLDSEIGGVFPARAVAFLRTHPQLGHMFNLYQWGGYLEWNLPQAPTFIDSRGDIFEYKRVLKDYLDVVSISDSQEILHRYGIDYVVYPDRTPLTYFLSKDTDWEAIYDDGQAAIYRRRQR